MPNEFDRDLQLAGMLRMSGDLDRPLPSGWWPRFRDVQLRDGDIIYNLAGGLIEGKAQADNMLNEFIHLPEMTPAAYLGFVQRFGPLRLHHCLLRLVDKHSDVYLDGADCLLRIRKRAFSLQMCLSEDKSIDKEASCLSVAANVFWHHFPDGLGSGELEDASLLRGASEPISVYRAVAERFREILNDVAEIYSGRSTRHDARIDETILAVRDPHIWRQEMGARNVCDQDDYIESLERQKGIPAAKSHAHSTMAELVEIADIEPRLEWKGDRWQIELCFPTAFGALVSKLMTVAARANCLYTCSGCGEIYIRSASGSRSMIRQRRAPKTGQRNYCSDCGRSAALLDAKRDYRRRIAEARSRYASGENVHTIRADLGVQAASLRKWLKGANRTT